MLDFLISPPFVKGDLGGFQRVGKIPPAPLLQRGEIYRVFVQALIKILDLIIGAKLELLI